MTKSKTEDIQRSIARLGISPFIRDKTLIAIKHNDTRTLAGIIERIITHAGYELRKEDSC